MKRRACTLTDNKDPIPVTTEEERVEAQVSEKLNSETSEEEVDELLKKYDTESNFAKSEGFTKKAITVISILMAAYQMYIAGFSFLNLNKQRAIHLAFILVIIFLVYPTFRKPKGKKGKTKLVVLDWVLAVLGAAGALYICFNYDALTLRNGTVITSDYIFGIITIIAVLYATYRVQGWVLPVLVGLFVVYAFTCQYIPGLLQHKGFSLRRIISQLYLGNEGIMGIPLGTSCTFIYLFILFGVILGETGLSRYLCDLAMALCGEKPGGPAKISILSSGFMGMISGNAVANVVTTGAFTIPLMKKTGYDNDFSGAVEAVASTGGQIMPPVMGSAAFIMAEMLSIPYKDIIFMALVPAVLYYVALWFAVDFEAKKKGLKGISKDNLPAAWEITKQYWHLLIPVIMLVVLICAGFSTNFCAFWSIIALLVISSLRKNTRLSLKTLVKICEKAAKQAVAAGICTAVVGILIGVVNMSGLGLKLSSIILQLAHNKLLLTLLFTMLACIILGMGLPTSAAYIVAATVAPLAMVKLGVPVEHAHLFVFYYACLSSITPPVALAAFAAAGIAEANPNKVGWTAVRIGLAAFIIPYMFIYSPTLLLEGNVLNIIISVITALIGVYLLSSSTIGYLRTGSKWYERVLLMAAALLLVDGGLTTDACGLIIAVGVFLLQTFRMKHAAASA